MSHNKVKLAFAVVLLLSYQQAVQALTKTTSFDVTATVSSVCDVSVTNLVFGDYDPSAADHDDTSTVTVTCTKATPYKIGLNEGSYGGGTVLTRKMSAGGTDRLNYSLFSDASRTVNWGNVDPDWVIVPSATGSAEIHTVYGRIATAQYVTAGFYTDTIAVTITY